MTTKLRAVEVKAVRIVTDGRVAVTYVSRTGMVISGLVRGDSGSVYQPTVDLAGSWCNCEWGQHHRGSECSHTIALSLQAHNEGLLPVAAGVTIGNTMAKGA